jgi:hypothetical protein
MSTSRNLAYEKRLWVALAVRPKKKSIRKEIGERKVGVKKKEGIEGGWRGD